MPIFMKAGSIEGDVAAKPYNGWVEVDSCECEVSFEEDDVRKSLAEGAPVPEFDTFDVEKTGSDRALPALMKWMVDGDQLDTVQFDVCGDTFYQGSIRCQMRYILKKVVLTDYTVNLGDGEKGAVGVNLRLRFDELRIESFTYEKDTVARTGSKTVASRRTK